MILLQILRVMPCLPPQLLLLIVELLAERHFSKSLEELSTASHDDARILHAAHRELVILCSGADSLEVIDEKPRKEYYRG